VGKSFSTPLFRILYLFTNIISPLQSGFAVSAKNFKRAVDRNRIRRLMKESYRLQKNILTQNLKEREKCMAVFFIYTGKRIPEYKDVVEKMQVALNRLQKIVNESSVGNS
jgi:ribonuclease P protein component